MSAHWIPSVGERVMVREFDRHWRGTSVVEVAEVDGRTVARVEHADPDDPGCETVTFAWNGRAWIDLAAIDDDARYGPLDTLYRLGEHAETYARDQACATLQAILDSGADGLSLEILRRSVDVFVSAQLSDARLLADDYRRATREGQPKDSDELRALARRLLPHENLDGRFLVRRAFDLAARLTQWHDDSSTLDAASMQAESRDVT